MIPFEDRCCKLCTKNLTEDEIHFICHDTDFDTEHKHFFLKMEQIDQNYLKFIHIILFTETVN